MMGRALLILGLIGLAGLLAAGGLAYAAKGASPSDPSRSHILAGLAACVVLLFSHSWVVLYLIATGRAIRGLVAERGLPAELAAAGSRLRNRPLGWAFLAVATAFGAFLAGSAAMSGAASAALHHALFFVAVAAQAWALWVERDVLAGHERLLADLERQLASHAA